MLGVVLLKVVGMGMGQEDNSIVWLEGRGPERFDDVDEFDESPSSMVSQLDSRNVAHIVRNLAQVSITLIPLLFQAIIVRIWQRL